MAVSERSIFRFVTTLQKHFAETGLTQKEFGKLVADAEGRERAYSQQQVSNWLTDTEPNSDQVFAIEKALGLEAGSLSQLLGYLPITALQTDTVIDAIRSDPYLSAEGKRVMEAAYAAATERVRAVVERHWETAQKVEAAVFADDPPLRAAAKSGKTAKKPARKAARPRPGAVRPEGGG